MHLHDIVWAKKDGRWLRTEIVASIDDHWMVRDMEGEEWEAAEVKDRAAYLEMVLRE